MRWSVAGIPRRGVGFHKGVLDKPSTSGGLFRVLGLVASEGLGFIGFRVYALTTRTSQARFSVRGRCDTRNGWDADFTPSRRKEGLGFWV